MSGQIVLIASYPKSGNTWVRLILETLLRGAPVSINDIDIGAYGAGRRQLFDETAPAEAGDLLPAEIEELLPDVYAALDSDRSIFLKVHDRLRKTQSGRWLFPPQCVKHVIYVVRHPFDVAVSYARHRGVCVAQAAALMGDEDHVIAPAGAGLPLSLAERPGTWSGNVASWLDSSPYPMTLIRYEDLHADSGNEIARIAEAVGLKVSEHCIAGAVDSTRFDRLQAEERARGFRERPRTSSAFFREGRPNSWIGKLDDALSDQLALTHGDAMRRLGYQVVAKR